MKNNLVQILFTAVFLLCMTWHVYALDFWPKGGFAGLGPELNAHSRSGLSFGGVLTAGFDLNEYFSAGIRLGGFHNFDTVSSIENLLFFRFYPPGLNCQNHMTAPLYRSKQEVFIITSTSIFSLPSQAGFQPAGGLILDKTFILKVQYAEDILMHGV